MGIPSPFNAPCSSPLLRLRQKSPELNLLQAVDDNGEKEQDLELLPVATVDLPSSCGALREVVWADCQDDAAGDSDDGQQEGQSESSSTCLPLHSESLESLSDGCAPRPPCAEPPAPAPAGADWPGAEAWQASGVVKADVSQIAPPCPTAPDAPGVLVQMLCRTWRDGASGMMVAPCVGDDAAADCDKDVFWCCVQTQQDGSAFIVPCSDAAACGVTLDAGGSPLEGAEAALGAPERPPLGSYAPTWIYGASWPFCVAPTTLVLSSLPDDLLQEDLIEVLDKLGFSCFYDFIYLPMDLEFNRNLGYAIVNLTRHEYGLALAALVYGRTSWCGATSTACQATWSVHEQGISQLLERHRHHPASREDVPEDMRPTHFVGGFPRRIS